MVPDSVVKKGFLKSLLTFMVIILLFFILLSAIFCYRSLSYDLSPHYGATYALITRIKDSLAIITLKINIIFYLLIAAGVGALGILYTHRIAGPLVRVKQFARSADGQGYGEELSFRDKDAITPLAEEINGTLVGYRERLAGFSGELKALEETLTLAERVSSDGAMDSAIIEDIRRVEGKLREEVEKLKI